MAADPIWFKPRAGFSAACCAYFGMSFDGGPVKTPMQAPKEPAGRPMKRAYPSMADARKQSGRRQHHGRGAGTAISK